MPSATVTAPTVPANGPEVMGRTSGLTAKSLTVGDFQATRRDPNWFWLQTATGLLASVRRITRAWEWMCWDVSAGFDQRRMIGEGKGTELAEAQADAIECMQGVGAHV